MTTTELCVGFVGSKSMGAGILRVLVDEVRGPHRVGGAVTLDDRSDPRSALADIRATAAERDVPLMIAPDAAAGVAALASLRPDLVILCGWYKLVPLRLFPGVPFYGFHAGPLPRYRGGAPVVWQIIEGQREIGLTLFRLSDRVDAGDIVAQGTVPLAEAETVAEATARLNALATRLLRDHLPAMLSGTVALRPQDERTASNYPQRSRSDGLIDLTQPCARVHDFVRAQTAPYPGAFLRLPDGRKLRVWRTEPVPTEHAEPGSVSHHPAGTLVGCGKGSVRIVHASVDGGPAAAPADLLCGVTSLTGRPAPQPSGSRR